MYQSVKIRISCNDINQAEISQLFQFWIYLIFSGRNWEVINICSLSFEWGWCVRVSVEACRVGGLSKLAWWIANRLGLDSDQWARETTTLASVTHWLSHTIRRVRPKKERKNIISLQNWKTFLPDKNSKMWNCVEDRENDQSSPFGRVIRKIIFDEIYADRTAILSGNPISPTNLNFLPVRNFYFPSKKAFPNAIFEKLLE